MEPIIADIRGMASPAAPLGPLAQSLADLLEHALQEAPQLEGNHGFIEAASSVLAALQDSSSHIGRLDAQVQVLRMQVSVDSERHRADVARLEAEIKQLRDAAAADRAAQARSAGVLIRQAAMDLQNAVIEEATGWNAIRRRTEGVDGFYQFEEDYMPSRPLAERESLRASFVKACTDFGVDSDVLKALDEAREAGDLSAHEKLHKKPIPEVSHMLESAVAVFPIYRFDFGSSKRVPVLPATARLVVDKYIAMRRTRAALGK